MATANSTLTTATAMPDLPATWTRGHNASAYARAMQELLPPGAAWDWPTDGPGFALLTGLGQELARVELELIDLLPKLPKDHAPFASSWHISTYQAIAQAAIKHVFSPKRQAFRAGRNRAGHRLWRDEPSSTVFDYVLVDHLVWRPFQSGGARAGRVLGSLRGRFLIRVRYFAGAIDLAPVLAALKAHAQAHVAFVCVDISGQGGVYATY